jgi:hypothetical protein
MPAARTQGRSSGRITLVPAAIRPGHGGRDVAVTPALLHSEVGAPDRRRPGAIIQAREHEKLLEEVTMGTYP